MRVQVSWTSLRRTEHIFAFLSYIRPVVYSTDRSKAVVPVTLCCFVVYSTRRFVLCLALCYFVLVFFSSFSIAIPRFGKRELVSVFLIRLLTLFDLRLFGFDCFLFLLVSGKGCGF